jgi:uncharacterized Zn-binding protein involved in type VI secretion
MAQPAARIGDMHTCPMADPSGNPHVGGPILPMGGGNPVLIGGMAAATLNFQCTCVGTPDMIIQASISVLINGKGAARQGDQTVHGGVITMGFSGVLIG